MAKSSGLGWSGYSVDNAAGTPVDVRNDTTSLTIATPRATQDVTGLDKSAMERLLLLSDGSVQSQGVFNPTGSHLVWKTIPSTSVLRTVTLTVLAQTLAMECIATDYSLGRSASGELTWTVPLTLADGTVPVWS